MVGKRMIIHFKKYQFNTSFFSEVLAVTFKSDGKEIACSTLDAQIIFINVNEVDQQAVTGTIECKHDLGYSRKDTDKVTAKKLQFGK